MSAVIFKFVRSQTVFKKKYFIQRLISSQSKLSENDVEEIKIPVPWGHIAGKWWGSKASTPVLAIHGWQDNANSFDRLIPLLNISSVLAIDLPGHGHSSHLPEGNVYDFGEFIITLQRIKKHFNWTQVPLLTHSFGGALGYVYSSLYPNEIKWHVNLECARALLTLCRGGLCSRLSKEVDDFLKIEKKKKEEAPPIYKLSKLIQMCIEGSLGSVSSPEAALVLLRRGIYPADNIPVESSTKEKSSKDSGGSDLVDFVESEREGTMLLPVEDQALVAEKFVKMMEAFEKIKSDAKQFHLDEKEDKYYVFLRDPSIKILVFQSFSQDFILEATKNVKCPILSIRANGGFLFGSTGKLYEKTLDILQKNCDYFEHHDVEGTHHVHLNEPHTLAPIINKFIEKYEQIN